MALFVNIFAIKNYLKKKHIHKVISLKFIVE